MIIAASTLANFNIRQRFWWGGLLLIVMMAAPVPLHATEPAGWRDGDVVIRAAAAALVFNSSAKVKVADQEIPGGSVDLSDNITMTGEIEYFPDRSVSLALVAGIPPQTLVTGTGSLAPVGKIGRVRYGIGALVARYHLNSAHRLSPFVGGGIGRFIVFSSEDGAVQDLHVNSVWGPVVQGGVDYHVNHHIGLYASVTYAPFKTNARGNNANGVPVTARATANPTVFQGGLSYRF